MQADWFVLENNEKATLHIFMSFPYQLQTRSFFVLLIYFIEVVDESRLQSKQQAMKFQTRTLHCTVYTITGQSDSV